MFLNWLSGALVGVGDSDFLVTRLSPPGSSSPPEGGGDQRPGAGSWEFLTSSRALGLRLSLLLLLLLLLLVVVVLSIMVTSTY